MRTETKARLDKALARLEDTPDHDLFAAVQQAQEDAEFYFGLRGRLEAETIRRVKDRDATMAVAGNLQAELEIARAYEWDVDVLFKTVRPLITPALWDECVTPIPPAPPKVTYKVSTAKLNGLKKKLGPVGTQLIEAACTVTEKPPKVVITAAGATDEF